MTSVKYQWSTGQCASGLRFLRSIMRNVPSLWSTRTLTLIRKRRERAMWGERRWLLCFTLWCHFVWKWTLLWIKKQVKLDPRSKCYNNHNWCSKLWPADELRCPHIYSLDSLLKLTGRLRKMLCSEYMENIVFRGPLCQIKGAAFIW